ncbi:unnamed protein product, partial [Rotaria socialis]
KITTGFIEKNDDEATRDGEQTTGKQQMTKQYNRH